MSIERMQVIYRPRGRAKEYSTLAVNLYQGCSHGCVYCYAPKFAPKNWVYQAGVPANPRPGILEKLEKDLLYLSNHRDEITDPVLLCFMCDPYQGDACCRATTRILLRLFREYNVPFQVLTKGGMKAARDFEFYTNADYFGTTLTYWDREASIKNEPFAALPMDRVLAIREAKKRGLNTWVSFEPVIHAGAAYLLFDATCKYVDLYKIGKCSGDYSKVTDWKRFAHTIIAMCERRGIKYLIKKDLRREM